MQTTESTLASLKIKRLNVCYLAHDNSGRARESCPEATLQEVISQLHCWAVQQGLPGTGTVAALTTPTGDPDTGAVTVSAWHLCQAPQPLPEN